MKLLSGENIANEIKYWFSKSIYEREISEFKDFEIYEKSIQIFKNDYLRYYPSDVEMSIIKIKQRLELVGILLYRISREYFLKGNSKCDYYSLLGRFLSGFEIYYSAEIGNGLRINHGIGTVIGARVKIGDNCLIHQNITLGDKNSGRPTIGNNITIYSGAKILGDIHIGDGSIIGANSVCLKNAPAGSVLVGIPSKLINK
mgnify:CR=1 FL=1